ncbi:MAG: fructoselysine 6-kinase, partial [Lactovum sp.]
SYTGVVGTDIYGDKMIEALKRKDIDVSHLRKLKGNTAITEVELVDGERVFGDYDEGVLKYLTLSDEDINFLSGHDIVISGLWGNVQSYFKKIKESSTKIAFDAATRPMDSAAQEALPYVDYFFFASDDVFNVKIKSLMKDLYEKGPKLVIVTLGELGSVVYDGKNYEKFGIIPCTVVDTMGAGDSYIAGFLTGILENKEIKEAMKLGAQTASETLSYNGAW